MEQWINDAREREDKSRSDASAQAEIRADERNRLAVRFPEWLTVLGAALQKISDDLAKKFPDVLARQYSVNPKTNGYFLRCQGFPEVSVDIEFQLATKTMAVRRSVRQSLHDTERLTDERHQNGSIHITPQDSQIFVRYAPMLWDEHGNVSQTPKQYSNPESLASNLMREATGL